MKDLHSYQYPAISPSLLAADHQHMGQELAKLKQVKASFVHIDIMDGAFVPAHSFGAEFVASLPKKHPFVYDTHIMVENPLQKAPSYLEAGADILTFHYEASSSTEIPALIRLIHSYHAKAGLSIKPLTPVEVLFPFLKDLDLVLLMSVEPGKGGQSFIPTSTCRLAKIREAIDQLPLEKRPLLEVDGGINDKTAPLALANGADLLVAGSYLFGHEDFVNRYGTLLGKKAL